MGDEENGAISQEGKWLNGKRDVPLGVGSGTRPWSSVLRLSALPVPGMPSGDAQLFLPSGCYNRRLDGLFSDPFNTADEILEMCTKSNSTSCSKTNSAH